VLRWEDYNEVGHKEIRWAGVDWIHPAGYGPVARCSVHGNGPLCSVEDALFLY